MTNVQKIWLIICLCFMFLWLTCGFFIFPLNIIGVFLTGITMIPCFLRNNNEKW